MPSYRARGTSGPRDPSLDGSGVGDSGKLDEPEFLTPYKISSSNARPESFLRDSRATQQRHRTVSIANLFRPFCSVGQPGSTVDWSCSPYEPPSYIAHNPKSTECTMPFGCNAVVLGRFEGSALAWSTVERRNSRRDGQRRAQGNSGCVKQPLLRDESCNVA